ncbi:Ubiquitin carboxyl-terminal hydrolase 7 [Dendrobium catenatum]|uniref:ubiquitinyl hydrolase 1 n=1 Tax=Dendrobium catenatum TaxID=906689 RepID=A0A2I0VD41_9ASPA|nr:Ubiquitin carboxyl-terminal hydrolase 7 [Dendrobium catenatum]
MEFYTVSVKWQKETFPAVEIDPISLLMQRIMVKGGLLKDDADWSTLGVKEGQRLMIDGKSPVFMEDLPEEEQIVNVGQSAGIFNLGNTCYLNSTLQCLHSVPELKAALENYTNFGRSNDLDQFSHLLTVATRDLFSELDRNVRPVAPLQFLSILRKKYPQFAQQHNGAYMQQDAEECWTQLMYTLSQSLKSSDSSEISSAVKTLFGIDLVSRIVCIESGEESSETESVYALKCHISQEVNHLHEGLKCRRLPLYWGAVPFLPKNLVSVICRGKNNFLSFCLMYLTVQFVRFFWKRETNQKAKILRKVDYPLELDVYDLCSEELRQKLQPPRQILREAENAKLGLKVQEKSTHENDAKTRNPEVWQLS